jgi:hypothetical protein
MLHFFQTQVLQRVFRINFGLVLHLLVQVVVLALKFVHQQLVFLNIDFPLGS